MAPRQSLVASGVTLSSSPPAHKSPSAPEETEAQGRHHSPEGGRAAWSPRSTASGAGRASAHVLRENYGRPLALRPVRPQPQLLKGLPVGCSRPLDVSGLGPCKLWLSHPHRYGRDRRAGQTGTPPPARTPPGGSPALPLRQLDLGRRTPGLQLGQDVRRRHWPRPRSPGRRRPRCPSSQRSLALGVTSPGVHAPLPLSLFCGVPTCGSLRRGPGTSRPRPRPCPRLDTASQVRAAGLAEALPVKPQACLGHAGPCRQAGRPEGAAVAGSTDGVKS